MYDYNTLISRLDQDKRIKTYFVIIRLITVELKRACVYLSNNLKIL